MPDQSSSIQFTWVLLAAALLVAVGCGTTRERDATNQLVMSDAVDRSIRAIDFRPLAGRKVYLDTSYLRHVKGQGFVNSEYVTSALRQQVLASGCLMQDTNQEADVIIEARIGTLGMDDHRVTFGVPENNGLASALRLIPDAPTVPVIPELAIARRDAREAAAKVAAFAYDRETRKPIWQSGVKHHLATARDTWVLGVGPFQGGSIREQTKLAGSQITVGGRTATGAKGRFYERPRVDYNSQVLFDKGWPLGNSEGLGPSVIPPPLAPPVIADETVPLEDVEIAEEPDSKKTIAEAKDNIKR